VSVMSSTKKLPGSHGARPFLSPGRFFPRSNQSNGAVLARSIPRPVFAAIAYVWHGALHATTVAESLLRQGFTICAQIIWAKERLVIGRGDYHWQHEPCWYAVRKKGNWTGDRKRAGARTSRQSTAPKSLWNACGGPVRSTSQATEPSIMLQLSA
jgi:hypothetical protein